MSYTAVLLPILAALTIAQEKLSLEKWIPTNAQQTILMNEYYPNIADLKKLSPKELSSCASTNFDEVNSFLKERGFTIQLDKTNAKPGDLAVASILDIALKWKVQGKKARLLL